MPTAGISQAENRQDANGGRRGPDGKFLPGNRSGGRPKGSPNRTTVDIRVVKREILASWHRIGGRSRLDEWAKANFGDYIKLIARLLPADIDLALPAREPTYNGPGVVLGPGASQLLEELRAMRAEREADDGPGANPAVPGVAGARPQLGDGNGQERDAS